jgi:hypothetical protein
LGSYSTLNLTFESDKLSAIAGLASRMAKQFKTTYIAGLWRRFLPYCLLWYPHDRSQSIRLDEYFPTWSWAAVHGELIIPPRVYIDAKRIKYKAKLQVLTVIMEEEVGTGP